MKEYRAEAMITVDDDVGTDDILRAVCRLLEREFLVGGISIQPEFVAREIDRALEILHQVSIPKGGSA